MPTRTRRLLPLLAAATATVAVACTGHTPARHPLTLTSYRGADWVTDGTITAPRTFQRSDRIRWPHTMDGAIMAAVDAQTLLDTAADDQCGDITRDYFAAAAGLPAYLTIRSHLHTTGDPIPARLARVRGFRFFAYTDTAATVEILLTQPDRSVTGLTRHLVWATDSWLIQLPAPDSPEKPVAAYDTLPDNIQSLPPT